MANNGFIKAAGTIVVSVDGKPYSVNSNNKALYDKVVELAKAGRFSEVPDTIDRLSSIVKKVEAKVGSFGELKVRDRRVYLINADGTESRLQGYEINKLLELMDGGFDIKPLSNFIVRVRQNPSEAVRQRLYQFMEYGKMPLVEDGSFLAYKVVGSNYKDKYSRTFDNSVGATCEMKRGDVNDNDEQTCSRGLHVCSKEYIKHFLYSGSDKLMVAKVAPEDVVSIPTDYNNTKMRTCKYAVIGEIKSEDDPTFFGKSVYTPAPVVTAPVATATPEVRRASNGRFVSGSANVATTTGPRRDAKGRFVS